MKLLFWLFVIVVAAVLADFAVTNRTSVTLGLWPLPFVVELPLYLAILGGLLVGFLGGAAAAWLTGGRRRRETRRRGRRIAALERELSATQAQMPAADQAVPALPSRT